VPDEAVGRNVRCPVCKSVILATPSAPPTMRNVSPETDIDPTMVRFHCGACGKEMQARTEFGGQETVCPGCDSPVMIPTQNASGSPPAPPLGAETLDYPAPAAPPVYRPTPLPDAPTSARRLRPARRRRRFWLWATLGTLLVAAAGVVPWYLGYGWFFWFGRDVTPPDLALVPPDAQAFVSVHAADVWKSETMLGVRNVLNDFRESVKRLETDLSLTVEDCERLTLVYKDVEPLFRPDSKPGEVDWWLIALTKRPYDRKRLLDKLLPGSAELGYQGRKYNAKDVEGGVGAVYFHTDRIFVVGTKMGIQACLDQVTSRKSDGPLKSAIREAAGKHHLVAGVTPTARTMDRLRKDLPTDAKRYEALLDLRTLTMTVDLAPSQSVEFTLTFADETLAREGKSAASALRTLAVEKLDQFKSSLEFGKMKPKEREAFDQVEGTLIGTTVEQKKDSVLVQIKSDLSVQAASLGLLTAGFEKVRDTAFGPPGQRNLTRLWQAMKEYHDRNDRRFPPAFSMAANKALLSWRVHILPYLGEEALYKEFHLNEPWDSPHNRTLWTRMPAVYRGQGQPPDVIVTPYQVFTGDTALFSGARQLGIDAITDGPGKTIAIVEANRPVNWTSPEDIPFKPDPSGGFSPAVLGDTNAPVFHAVLFDGTPTTFLRNIDPKRLKALITPNGKD
jgi:DNA-directed RNA polymerase subunit RPC12/RpoP